MQLLDALNQILPKLGERPVTSTDSKSPTLAMVIPQINTDRASCLQQGWWFNTFKNVSLYPDSEGGLAVPDDTLSFVANKGQPMIVTRGTKFLNAGTQSYIFPVGTPIVGTLIQDIPNFDELPESTAKYVLYTALVTCYATDIGLESVVNLWSGYAKAAEAAMEQEHLRQMQYTIKNSRQYVNLRNAMRG